MFWGNNSISNIDQLGLHKRKEYGVDECKDDDEKGGMSWEIHRGGSEEQDTGVLK